MGTHSDFTTGTLSSTANTETKVGTINVQAGATLKQIVVANRTFLGTIYAVRIDYAGIKTPKKWILPALYEATGTEVEYVNAWNVEPIKVNIKLPNNVSTIDVYATADTASVKAAVGLVWV